MVDLNSHKKPTLVFNLNDSVVKGSEDSEEAVDVVTTRYQLRFDMELLRHDAFARCKADPVCKDLVSVSGNTVLMLVYEKTFEDYEDFTTDERLQATETYKYMESLVAERETSEAKLFEYLDAYFLKFLPLEIAEIKTTFESEAYTLTTSFYETYTDTTD
mmetsp:Transcript_12197/g.18863  ORF Transcript_12197/g.18863 Transcript_12197/m.18863 type:complete len:160 (+) Transcript_12197:879-1358(+)